MAEVESQLARFPYMGLAPELGGHPDRTIGRVFDDLVEPDDPGDVACLVVRNQQPNLDVPVIEHIGHPMGQIAESRHPSRLIDVNPHDPVPVPGILDHLP